LWKDKWLPNPTTYIIQSPLRVLEENVKVEEIIDAQSRTWKNDLIEDVFLDYEAQIIKGISLSPVPTKDRLIWRCTTNGQFFV
jgi:hypothetical protein